MPTAPVPPASPTHTWRGWHWGQREPAQPGSRLPLPEQGGRGGCWVGPFTSSYPPSQTCRPATPGRCPYAVCAKGGGKGHCAEWHGRRQEAELVGPCWAARGPLIRCFLQSRGHSGYSSRARAHSCLWSVAMVRQPGLLPQRHLCAPPGGPPCPHLEEAAGLQGLECGMVDTSRVASIPVCLPTPPSLKWKAVGPSTGRGAGPLPPRLQASMDHEACPS